MMKGKLFIVTILSLVFIMCSFSTIYPEGKVYSTNESSKKTDTISINVSKIMTNPITAISDAEQVLELNYEDYQSKIDAYFILSYASWWIGDMEQSKKWADKYNELAIISNKIENLTAAKLLYMLYYKDTGDLEKARTLAEEALNQTKHFKSSEELNYYTTMISEKYALILIINGELNRATNFLLEALDYYSLHNEGALEINTINNLIVLFTMRKDYEKALAYVERGIDLAKEQEDVGSQILLLSNEMQCLLELGGEFDYSEKSKELLDLLSEYDSMWHQYAGKSVVSLAYLKYGEYEKAKEFADISVKMAEESDDLYGVYTSKVVAAAARSYLGEYNKSISDITEYLLILEDYGDIGLFKEILAQVYEDHEDYKKALELYKEIKEDHQAFFLDERQREVDELETIYETEKKEQEILLLNTSNQLKNKELESQETKQKYTMFVTMALILLVVLLILEWRRTCKVNHQLQILNNKLNEMSLKDTLTGLYNRRYLLSHIDNAIAYLKRKLTGYEIITSKLSFFMIDIDYFKKINDTEGHFAGDEVLQEISRRFVTSLRACDIAIRWGGEEFLIVAMDTTNKGAKVLADKIRLLVGSTPFNVNDKELQITCSVGYCTFPFYLNDMQNFTWEHSIMLADKALYKAKEEGRNRVVGIEEGQKEVTDKEKAVSLIVNDSDKAIEMGLLKWVIDN